MKKISKEELNNIIEQNTLYNKSEGKKGKRANLYGVDLSGMDLQHMDLQNAYLRGADMECVDLRDSNLKGADMWGAFLSRANLSRCNIEGADLMGVDLVEATLQKTNMQGSNLHGIDLSNATLHNVNLQNTNLNKANLTGVDLRTTNLKGAIFYETMFYNVIGNGKEIKSLQIGGYNICYTKDFLQIGYRRYSVEEWKKFSIKKILSMEGIKGLVWWLKNKNYIFKTIKNNPAE